MRAVVYLLAVLVLAKCVSCAIADSPACTFIRANGYPCEEHQVLTSDGWYLRMQRIPHGKSRANATKGVAFFQHGLTDDSTGCVLNPPLQAFPYHIADAGYEMWLGNNRGNGISMQNIHYTPSDAQFWDFSWDDMALIDLPTQLNYVLAVTKARKLAYMGHSQGTVQAFAGFIANHTLASQVSVYIALAPVGYVYHQEAILLRAMADMNTQILFDLLGVHEFALPSAIEKLIPGYCKLFKEICAFSVQLVCGPSKTLNNSMLPFYVKYEMNPTSVKNMVHWAQGVKNNVYQRYDYGSAGNVLHYNQTTPPAYNFGQFPTTLPTALFTGSEDYLADPKDVAQLLAQISVPPMVHNEPNFAHLDPLLGETAYQLIYPRFIQLLDQYNTGHM